LKNPLGFGDSEEEERLNFSFTEGSATFGEELTNN
jgi:hypothetical protein